MRTRILLQQLADAQATNRALQEELAETNRGQVALTMELEELKSGALSESELRYRTLADSGQALIWSSGLDKKCDYFNQPWLAFTGRTLEQELGDGWAEGVHPDDRARCFEIYATAFDRRERFSRDYRLRRHDGEFRWIQDDGSPRYDSQGNFLGCIGHCLDITERLRNERLALRTQRLESLGTLTGGIAHDMNNSLAPIMMGVDLLRKQYPQESKILNIIDASAKRGADMVRHLLGFAKGVEGKHVSLPPDRLLNEMENIVKGSFPKNIELVVQCDPELPSVLGDATQIHQVLLNLCVNARDAMPHGGTLTLEVESREVDATYASSVPEALPGQYLVLRVSDTGSGMQPEILDRIFDPFFTTKGPDKGTGLGLSTVAGIVKGHGGFLQVYSHPGTGSTFTVYLPAERAGNDTEPVAKTAVTFHGHGETILFVDDETAVREVAREVLQQLNFIPLTATDGTDGLMQAAQHRTGLRAIITDLHMPHLDGLAFVRALRQMLPDIPVIVASGRMEDGVAAEFKALGVTTRLDKPFTEAQLAAALKKVFQK